jgi:hypothetical protein
VILGFMAGNVAILLVCLGIAALYLIVLALVQSALQAIFHIFQAGLYLYARDGQTPPGFRDAVLRGAIS